MDLSTKIIKNTREIETVRQKTSTLQALESYASEDKVISFGELLEEINAGRALNANVKFYAKIPALDALTDGFRMGQLNVLSAPTGNGKTAFLQDLTRTFTDQGVPCLWFSYEMPPAELGERFGDSVPKFYLPRKLKESSLDWMKLRILEGIAKYETRVIFIDHLHYLLDMNMLSQARSASLLIGMLMRELKKFAISTETTIFLVSHLTKTKLEAVPTIDDLRDSSFVGQEADIVMIMWRHREKDNTSPTGYRFTNESRLVVDKNRVNGKLGFVKMLFSNGKFTEITGNYEQAL